ncbi:pmp10 [Symbiodinium necroappetens]|uniref:Pmp10 protein n=1 Tax=Symbiodinium necroappetens TaxID=1628268 RepID=A0A812ZFH9_9DINO|nr:pmp10 [Symbiodinium necroappetens]
MKPYAIFINCFLPDLLGAVLRYVPCMHFQAGYRARFSTYDVTAACPWELYRYTILAATILLGAVVGPVFWVLVIKRSSKWQPDERREVLGFLTSGYKEACEWWEAGVLTRKCLLVMAASLFPMSYSPFLFLTSLLVIMGTSLTLHTLAWPYSSDVLNQLELAVLTSSTIVILCAMILTLQPIVWTLDYSITHPALASALLLLLSPFVVLLYLLLYEVRKKESAMIQRGFSTFCSGRESNGMR